MYMLTKRVAALMVSLLLCIASLAQVPVYVTKALKPVSQKGYNPVASIQVRGHQTWKNAFTLEAGEVTFNLDGKYENISFVMAPKHYQIYKDPDIVLIHADGRKIFDSPVKTDDLPRHITLNVSGVKSLKFSMVDNGMVLAFCEVALWTKGLVPGGRLTVENPGGTLYVTLSGDQGQVETLLLEGPADVLGHYEIAL